MLSDKVRFIRSCLYVVDLLIAAVLFFVVYFFGRYFHEFYSLNLLPGQAVVSRPLDMDLYIRVFWLAIVIWAVLLRVRGKYHHLSFQTSHRALVNYTLNGLIFFAVLSASAFYLRMSFVSRSFLIAYSAGTAATLSVTRIFILTLLHYLRRGGHGFRNIILVGTGRRAQDFMSLVAKHREWGYRIVGLLDSDPSISQKTVAGYPVIGALDDLPALLEKHVVDEVVLIVPRDLIGQVEKCVRYCEAVGVPATLGTDFFDLEISRSVPKEIEGFTFLTFETRLLITSELFVKRIFDVLFAFVLLVISLPALITAVIAVKMSSPGPVFFKQVRSGRNGRRFHLYKFRSMGIDAESRLDSLRDQNEMSGPVFKMEKDPRVTTVGRFLRKTSLDEFPQLWNVLKGEMSLIGPRPPLPQEVENYEPWQRRRLSMKPGITCIWQVSGRNNIDFEDWMRLDLQYIDHWTLWLDIKILLKTVRAVLLRQGAK